MPEPETNFEFPRSPLLMNRDDTAIVIIDVQERLLPHILDNERLIRNIGRIIAGATILDLPIRITEQYPCGLGPTSDQVLVLLEPDDRHVHEKTMFSMRQCDPLLTSLNRQEIANVMLVGIETHVCVLQSALDILAVGLNVFVCADAVGSRFEFDHETALRRLETSGVTLVTTEMVLFEWCEISGTDEFREISKLVKS